VSRSRKKKKAVQAAARRRRLRVWFIAAKVAVVAVVVASAGVVLYRDVRAYLGQTHRYRVAHIEVTGAHRLSKDDVIRCSGVQVGAPLFELDRDAVAANVATHHRIRSALVRVTVPDQVAIDVVERVPVALVVFNRAYEIDADGIILGEYEKKVSPEGPIISGIEHTGSPTEGARIGTKGLSEALELWRLFSSDPLSKELTVSEIDLSDSNSLIMIFSNRKYEIRWPREGFAQSLQRLRNLWSESRGLPDARQYVDLRFDNNIPTR
jgi:cell division protein FtsQ